MSKKITGMPLVTGLTDDDFITGVDNAAIAAEKNVRITKANLLAGLAADADVSTVADALTTHEETGAAEAHPDGINQGDLNAHKAGVNQHPISGVTGLQTQLDAKEDIANLGDAAYKDTGTGVDEVAAGNAPSASVNAHNNSGTAHDGNLLTSTQKAAMDSNASLGAGNPVAGLDDIVDEGILLKSTGQSATKVLQTDGLGGFTYIPTPDGGSGGVDTNISVALDPDFVTINSSTGTGDDIPTATPSGDAGVMSGVQAQLLDDQPKSQVTTQEKTDGTETAIRWFAPKDVYDMAMVHLPNFDLGNVPASTTLQVTITNGNNTTLPAAVAGGNAGVMTGANAQKLAAQPASQITEPEKVAGTVTALRLFAPKDVADMVADHESPTPGTNLTNTPTGTTVAINSSTGGDTTLAAAVADGNAGVMTGAQAKAVGDNTSAIATNAAAIALKLDITGGTIADYGEDANNLGAVTGTANISLDDGVVHYGSMSGDTAFTLVNPSAHAAASVTLLLTTGGHSVSFANAGWAGDVPDLSASGTYLLAFFLIGGNWYGVLAA